MRHIDFHKKHIIFLYCIVYHTFLITIYMILSLWNDDWYIEICCLWLLYFNFSNINYYTWKYLWIVVWGTWKRRFTHWDIKRRHQDRWPYEINRGGWSSVRALKGRTIKYSRMKDPKYSLRRSLLGLIGGIDVCP